MGFFSLYNKVCVIEFIITWIKTKSFFYYASMLNNNLTFYLNKPYYKLYKLYLQRYFKGKYSWCWSPNLSFPIPQFVFVDGVWQVSSSVFWWRLWPGWTIFILWDLIILVWFRVFSWWIDVSLAFSPFYPCHRTISFSKTQIY